MIGRTLGHYHIIREIGAGGMGLVYKARDLHLDRFVALKTLPPEKVSDMERKKRFIQEAKAASSLNHPNIVHIYDITSDDGVDYIAMEYIEGKTLAEQIGHRGLPLNKILKYAIQITDALAKAHAAGIIHRDLKPNNIMVDDDGTVKLLDFGLAKLTEPAQSDEFATTATSPMEEKPITEKGIIVGTAAYMSPEQVEGKVVDPRSDIFSFGSMLYEMTTGRRAFEGANMFSTVSAILNKEPPPFTAEVPYDLAKTIARCMRKDPAKRFQNVADLKVALEELKEESDSHRSATIVSRKQTSEAARFAWKPVTVVVISCLVVMTAVWLYFAYRSDRGQGEQSFDTSSGGNLTLLVSSAGQVSGPALSPDGKMLAYIGEDMGRKDLFVCRVAGGERVRLTYDDAEEEMPSFSPDGEYIAYTSTGQESRLSEIWTIPTLGGQATRILENALDVVWSPDGKRLAYVFRQPNEGDALAISEANGQNITVVARSDGDLPFFRTLSWSPDGKFLAVTRSSGGSAGELWIVPLDGSAPRRVSNDPPGIFSARPLFTANGRGLIHQSNRAGATNLWVLLLDNGQTVRLTSGPGPDSMPSVARNGDIAFVNAHSRSHLIIYDFASGKSREIFSHSSYIWAPAFSPSGHEIALSRAEQDGSWHIWTIPARGGDARQLTTGSLPEIYPRYTPDGEFIIYHTWSPGPDRVWRVPRTGGPPQAVTPARNDDDQYADVSPDGEWIAFARTENKTTRIFLAPTNGGEANPLLDSPSTLPRWSPDGEWIAFSPSRGYIDGLFMVKPNGTGMRRVTELGGWPVWFPDGSQLGYQNIGIDGVGEHCAISLSGGSQPSRLIPLRFAGINNPFDISPDGTLLATTDTEMISSDIWLLKHDSSSDR